MTTKREILDAIANDYRNGVVAIGCIRAPGVLDSKGYGRVVSADGTRHRASNYVLRQAVGEPPPDRPMATHTCRSKSCVNVDHLEWGDAQSNSDDRYRDGTVPNGEANGRAKLDDDDVREMRRLYAAGEATYASLAETYGISTGTVSAIIKRRTWTHVD